MATDQEIMDAFAKNAAEILRLEQENERLRAVLTMCQSYAIETGAKREIIEAIAAALSPRPKPDAELKPGDRVIYTGTDHPYYSGHTGTLTQLADPGFQFGYFLPEGGNCAVCVRLGELSLVRQSP